jgi:hypothetical protein
MTPTDDEKGTLFPDDFLSSSEVSKWDSNSPLGKAMTAGIAALRKELPDVSIFLVLSTGEGKKAVGSFNSLETLASVDPKKPIHFSALAHVALSVLMHSPVTKRIALEAFTSVLRGEVLGNFLERESFFMLFGQAAKKPGVYEKILQYIQGFLSEEGSSDDEIL